MCRGAGRGAGVTPRRPLRCRWQVEFPGYPHHNMFLRRAIVAAPWRVYHPNVGAGRPGRSGDRACAAEGRCRVRRPALFVSEVAAARTQLRNQRPLSMQPARSGTRRKRYTQASRVSPPASASAHDAVVLLIFLARHDALVGVDPASVASDRRAVRPRRARGRRRCRYWRRRDSCRGRRGAHARSRPGRGCRSPAAGGRARRGRARFSRRSSACRR
jgi:hypothetical protein